MDPLYSAVHTQLKGLKNTKETVDRVSILFINYVEFLHLGLLNICEPFPAEACTDLPFIIIPTLG